MQKGSLVKLKAFGDKEIIRRVVFIEGATVYICKEEEFINAQNEGREPVCVGFHFKDILEEINEVIIQ